ncbi:MAG: exopolysaccharide biosynthesis protein [Planctomycetota bacterium]
MDHHPHLDEKWATFTPSDLSRVVFHRLPSVIAVTLLVAAVIAALAIVWPNRYQSEGMFYVRLGRGAVSVDPTTKPERSVSLQESRTAEVMSISQMLNSRELLDRVVRKVGVREINHPRDWIERTRQWVIAQSSRLGGGGLEMDAKLQIAHEEAVKKVRGSVGVTVPKDSYTVSIAGQLNDPELIQQIVQAMMDEYTVYHVEAHKATGSVDFFETQAAQSRTAAVNSRKALQQAREEMGWLSPETAEASLQERVRELQLALDQAISSHADAVKQSEVLAIRLAATEKWVETEVEDVANEAADAMQAALYEARLIDNERLAKLKPTHPRYRILQKKLSDSEDVVGKVKASRKQATEALNPVYVSLLAEHETSLARAAGMESKRDSLKQGLEKAQSDLQRLNRDSTELAQLAWESEIAEKNYLDHAQSLEASRVSAELDRQNMSDVSVIQPATLNLKKVGPPRIALIALGGMIGLFLGVCQSVARPLPTIPRNKNRIEASKESSLEASLPRSPKPASEVEFEGQVPIGTSGSELQTTSSIPHPTAPR